MRTIGVAIAIPEPWATQLTQARFSTGDPFAENVPPHVTLIGPSPVESDQLPAVEEILVEVAVHHAPFTIQLRGTGTFRPVTDVVFISVARGIGECEQLQAAMRRGPLEREMRFPYHPHVTIAHDVPAPALNKAFTDWAGFSADFDVPAFSLYEHGSDGLWRPRREFVLRGSRNLGSS